MFRLLCVIALKENTACALWGHCLVQRQIPYLRFKYFSIPNNMAENVIYDTEKETHFHVNILLKRPEKGA